MRHPPPPPLPIPHSPHLNRLLPQPLLPPFKRILQPLDHLGVRGRVALGGVQVELDFAEEAVGAREGGKVRRAVMMY